MLPERKDRVFISLYRRQGIITPARRQVLGTPSFHVAISVSAKGAGSETEITSHNVTFEPTYNSARGVLPEGWPFSCSETTVAGSSGITVLQYMVGKVPMGVATTQIEKMLRYVRLPTSNDQEPDDSSQ